MTKRDVCDSCGKEMDCTVYIIMSSYTLRRFCSNCTEEAQYYGLRPYGLVARVKRFLYISRPILAEVLWTGAMAAVAVAANCYTTGILASLWIVGLSMLIGAGAVFRLLRPS